MGGRSRNSRKKYRKTKPQRILIRCGFLVGAGGCREPRRKGTRVAAPSGCIVPWAARASCWPQPQQLLPVSAAGSGRRCCTGAFPRRTIRRVDAVRIHPPSLREGYYKTETPVPGSDTGVLGGRGWIRTTEAEKQQIYSLSPLATREHAQILFTSVTGRLVYFIRLRAICQLLFSDFCSFSAEAVGRVSFGSDVSGARNPARRQWLRQTWGIGQ